MWFIWFLNVSILSIQYWNKWSHWNSATANYDTHQKSCAAKFQKLFLNRLNTQDNTASPPPPERWRKWDVSNQHSQHRFNAASDSIYVNSTFVSHGPEKYAVKAPHATGTSHYGLSHPQMRISWQKFEHTVKLSCLPVNSMLEEPMIQTEVRVKISSLQLFWAIWIWCSIKIS